MHRFAEMLAREIARNIAEDQVVAVAETVPKPKGKEASKSCQLGCGGGRESSALARHKQTKMHVKAEADVKARAGA